MELRHVLEIHAVNANEKSQRYEDGGDDREDSHHFVSAHTQTGNVKVHDIPNSVPVAFQEIDDGHRIIVAIPKERLCAIGNQTRFVSPEAGTDISSRPD
jgi:hypothetical protein